jgi:YD repeat-containing protein
VIETVAGAYDPAHVQHIARPAADGALATDVDMMIWDVDVGRDGSLYLAGYVEEPLGRGGRIWRVMPDGRLYTLAGGGGACGLSHGHLVSTPWCGEGIPGTQANVSPVSIAVDDCGGVYFGEGNRIRHLDADGVLRTVVGQPAPTIEAPFPRARRDEDPAPDTGALEWSHDGSLVWLEAADASRRTGRALIRKLDPGGGVTTLFEARDPCTCTNCGGSQPPEFECNDGAPARDGEARPEWLSDIAAAPDGSLYVTHNCMVHRITPEGAWERIRNNRGGDIRACAVGTPRGDSITAGPDGDLYLYTDVTHQVLRLNRDGSTSVVAGTGSTRGVFRQSGPPEDDGGLASRTEVVQDNLLNQLAFGPDGSLYLIDGYTVRRIAASHPRIAVDEHFVPSADGGEVYVFDGARHERTLDGLTGRVLYELQYDGDNRLVAVVDGDAGTTTIARDIFGQPIAIVSPEGHSTFLEVDGRGLLARIAAGGGSAQTYEYEPDGLLTRHTGARGDVSTYEYDRGRLVRADGPEGTRVSLARQEVPGGFVVSKTRYDDATGQR